MNYKYYSNLDKIILRSRRKRMIRKYVEIAQEVGKFALSAVLVWGSFYFVWWATSF